MNWEQMFAAINALSPAALKMREPGNWYVSQSGVEIGNGVTLGTPGGRGRDPESAVCAYWKAITVNLTGVQRIVLGAMTGEKRRELAWNGYMWADVWPTLAALDPLDPQREEAIP